MSIYVKTVKICSVGVILTALVIIAIKSNLPLLDSIWLNLLIGTFTGFLVAFIISLSNYFHEKSNLLLKIKKDMLMLYINMLTLEKTTCTMVDNSLSNEMSQNIAIARVETVHSLAERNPELLTRDTLLKFSSFCNRSKESALIQTISAFRFKLSELLILYKNVCIRKGEYEISCISLKHDLENGPKVIEENRNKINAELLNAHTCCKCLLGRLKNIIDLFFKLDTRGKEEWEQFLKERKE